MKGKVNLREYQGKDRIYVPVTGAPRISRLYVWSADRSEYRPPERGRAYQARRYRRDGKRETAFFHSLPDARTWQITQPNGAENPNPVSHPQADEVSAQPPVGTEAVSPTFAALVEEWKRRTWSKRRQSTQAQYTKLLRLYFKPLMPVPTEEITPKVIDNWIDYLKDEQNEFAHAPTRTGFRHELRLLTTILKYYVESNDDTSYVVPIKKRHREAIMLNKDRRIKHRDLTEAEFLRFRAALLKGKRGPQMAALATIQFYQALRISEAAAIHWEDLRLDFENPMQSRLRCTKSIYWARIRGTKAQVVHSFKNAKANAGVKESPLMPATFAVLKGLFSSGSKGLVFSEGGEPLEYRWIQAAFDAAFARAGLDYSATHVMRHGMTRKVFNETGDLALAGQLLGNTTEQSIRVYAKRSTQALNQYAEKKWNEADETGCNWLQKQKASEEA